MNDPKSPEPKEVEEMVESLSEWLKKQPHLPQIDKELLKKFLVYSKFRLQVAKTKIDNYYTARTNYPLLFQNRDPTSQEIRKAATQVHFCPLPQVTKDGYEVVICKMTGEDGDLNPKAISKLILMGAEVAFKESTTKLDYIVVVDFRGSSLQHFMKLGPDLKTHADIVQNVLPGRLKAIHYVHAPSFVNKAVELVNMFITKPKLNERIKVHRDMETFYEAIGDRDMLPSDLGGKQPSISELHDKFQKKLESYKSWFEKEEHLRSNEDLRPPNSKNSWLMGTEGSFKKLNVD